MDTNSKENEITKNTDEISEKVLNNSKIDSAKVHSDSVLEEAQPNNEQSSVKTYQSLQRVQIHSVKILKTASYTTTDNYIIEKEDNCILGDESTDGLLLLNRENSKNEESNPSDTDTSKSKNIKTNISNSQATQTEKSTETENIYEFTDDEEDLEQIEKRAKLSKDHKCCHCYEYFDTPLDVLKHKREKHTYPKIILPHKEVEKHFEAKDRSQCPICSRPVKSRGFRSIFIKHLLTHTVGVAFQCKICHQMFQRRDHRDNHEKRHIFKPPV